MTAFPTPRVPESSAVPSDHCFGFDDPQGRSLAAPQTGEPDPKESVGSSQTYFVGADQALKDQELMPKGKDLCLERDPGSNALANRRK